MKLQNKPNKGASVPWKRKKQKKFWEAQRLHKQGKNKTQISEILGIRRATIVNWFKHDQYIEARGWQKGQTRKYEATTDERVCTIKRQRIENNKYFVGSEYVQMDYAKQYPDEQPPSIWFIDEAIRKAGLQTRKPKKRKKGGSQYLLYPVQAIRNFRLLDLGVWSKLRERM